MAERGQEFDFLGKLTDLVLGGIPTAALAILPRHLKARIAARASDILPSSPILANEDLVRAVRLAWIEAALQVLETVPDIAREEVSQGDLGITAQFVDVARTSLIEIRDAALDRRMHPGNSPIDAVAMRLVKGLPARTLPHAPVTDHGLTAEFATVLGEITGWAKEVPTVVAQVAGAGLPVLGRHPSRSFGELVFASFAETIKDPTRYPQARTAFHLATSEMSRELAQATLDAVKGVDGQLDRVLAGLDALEALRDGAVRYLWLLPDLVESIRTIQTTTSLTHQLVQEQGQVLREAATRLSMLSQAVLEPLPVVRGYAELHADRLRRLPTAVLLAEHGIVPFDDAAGYRDRLLAWATRSEGPRVAGLLVTGAGGIGKTRLALELVTALNALGWNAGLLPPRTAGDDSNDDLDGRLRGFVSQADKAGIALVLDYSETRISEVERIARLLTRTSVRVPVRLVLLARAGGPWWEDLLKRDRFAQGLLDPDPWLLTTRQLHSSIAEKLYRSATDAFTSSLLKAQDLDRPLVTADGAARLAPPSWANESDSSTPLTVVCEAYLRVRGVASHGSTMSDLAREERTHWMRVIEHRVGEKPAPESASLLAVGRCVAAVTLVQGSQRRPRDEAVSTLYRATLVPATLAIPDPYLRAVRLADLQHCVETLYGGGQAGLLPIRPDVLGEHIVAQYLAGSEADVVMQVLSAFPERAQMALEVLARAQVDSHAEETRQAAARITVATLSARRSFRRHGQSFVAACKVHPGILEPSLMRALELMELDDLESALSLMPLHTAVLGRANKHAAKLAAVKAAGTRTSDLDAALGFILNLVPSLPEDYPSKNRLALAQHGVDLARLHSDPRMLGFAMLHMGNAQLKAMDLLAAAEAFEQSISCRREALGDPAAGRDQLSLAISIMARASMEGIQELPEAERMALLLEAIDHLERAADAIPSEALSWLAKAHAYLAQAIGRKDGALARHHRLRAVEVVENALASDPDEALVRWLEVVDRVAYVAFEQGDSSEALSHLALMMRRTDHLVKTLDPGAAASVATRLSNCVQIAWKCGAIEMARRCHDASLKLAEYSYEEDPVAAAETLALVLLNATAACGVIFHDIAQARTCAQRAVAVFESLYGMQPTAHAGMLASALDNYALTLDGREAWDERTVAQKRSVDLFDEAVLMNARQWRPERIRALRNLAKAFLGRQDFVSLLPILVRLRTCYDLQQDDLSDLRAWEVFWCLGYLGTFACRAGDVERGAAAYREVEMVLDRIEQQGAVAPAGDELIAATAALGSAARMHEVGGDGTRARQLLLRAIGFLEARVDQEGALLRGQLQAHLAEIADAAPSA